MTDRQPVDARHVTDSPILNTELRVPLTEAAEEWLASLTWHQPHLLAKLRTDGEQPLLGRARHVVETSECRGHRAIAWLEQQGHPVGPVIRLRRRYMSQHLAQFILDPGCREAWETARQGQPLNLLESARLLPLYETIWLPGLGDPERDAMVSWLIPPIGTADQPTTDPTLLAAALAATHIPAADATTSR